MSTGDLQVMCESSNIISFLARRSKAILDETSTSRSNSAQQCPTGPDIDMSRTTFSPKSWLATTCILRPGPRHPRISMPTPHQKCPATV